MKNSILTFFLSMTACWAFAQNEASFSVSVSTDSLLMGNRLQVVFTLENAQATDFTPPPFDGFYILGGPNVSSSFSVVNGQVSQRATYTYYLEPVETGNYYIEPAGVRVDEKVLATEPLEIMVVPNPDGIHQEFTAPPQSFEFRFDDQLPPPFPPGDPAPAPKKKKRKIYKL